MKDQIVNGAGSKGGNASNGTGHTFYGMYHFCIPLKMQQTSSFYALFLPLGLLCGAVF
jgi:hypothetical protein